MKRVVIESPYGNPDPNVVAENEAYAEKCALECLDRSEAPYASHLFFTRKGLLNDRDPDERKLGIAAGFAWADAAEKVYFYTDRGFSQGMADALERVIEKGTPYEFRRLGIDGDLTLSYNEAKKVAF